VTAIAVTAVHVPDTRIEAALAAQTRAPDAAVASASPLGGVTWPAADWVWLLDGSAVPRADALERLCAAIAPAGLPHPDLLASQVAGAAGGLSAGAAPWYRRGGDVDQAMRAAVHGLLPLRAASAASLLVRVKAARATEPPRAAMPARAAALEWTARITRGGAGYLVPASVAHAGEWPGSGLGDAVAGGVLLVQAGWTPRERLWLAAEAATRARAGAGLSFPAAGARRRGRRARRSSGSRS
jgi:hypothetical protein